MCRKWKKMAAFGLAVLIGGMMPMGTMLAAEEDTETVQEIAADAASDIDADDEEVNVEDENVDDEEAVDDVIVDEVVNADNDGNSGIVVMSVADAEEGGVEVQTAAPVISIKWNNGEDCACSLGGTIEYKYVNNKDTAFECSVKHNNQDIAFLYYLDYAEKVTDPAKEEGQLQNVSWSSWSEKYAMTLGLGDEKNYVLYVKAEIDGQTTYARSGGVVVDTTVPKIAGVENGGTYPAGTTFTVSDANLSEVLINEQKAEPEEGGKYKVATQENSTSCVVRLRDKAGNEKVYSVNVSKGLSENGVISANGIYSLQEGTSYKLSAGKWQVAGDSTVYQGDNTFYVKSKSAGDYSFTKR